MTDKKASGWVVKKDDVRLRLRQAAMALFREHGYDRTTAAGIAARAGVTERTFFRHFPDKREVLFDGEAVMKAALTTAVAEAPSGLAPLPILFRAFHSFLPAMDAGRGYAEPRQALIAATPALQERELMKIAALTDALAASLKARGVSDLAADLAAQSAMGAFVQATIAWLADPAVALADRLDQAAVTLREILG